MTRSGAFAAMRESNFLRIASMRSRVAIVRKQMIAKVYTQQEDITENEQWCLSLNVNVYPQNYRTEFAGICNTCPI